MTFAPTPRQVGMIWCGLVAVVVLRLGCGWALPSKSGGAYFNNPATNTFQPYVPPRPALPAGALVARSPASGVEHEAYLDLSQQGQHGRIVGGSGTAASSAVPGRTTPPKAERQALSPPGRSPVLSEPVTSSPPAHDQRSTVIEAATAPRTSPAEPAFADYSQIGTPAGQTPPRLLVGLPHNDPTNVPMVMNLATQGQATPTKLAPSNPLVTEIQNITLTDAGRTSVSHIDPLNPLDDAKSSLDQQGAGSPTLRRIAPLNLLITDSIAIDLSNVGRLSSP